MIGDGSCVKRQPIRYASIDEANLECVSRRRCSSASRPSATSIRLPGAPLCAFLRRTGSTHGKRNPIAAWLDGLGVVRLRSYEKFVPRPVFALPNDQVALFLRHLWATDGSCALGRSRRQGRVYYASTSRRLVDDVRNCYSGRRARPITTAPRRPGTETAWHLADRRS